MTRTESRDQAGAELDAGRLAVEDYLLLAAVCLLPWGVGGVLLWAHRGASLLIVLAACIALWKRGLGGWGFGASRRDRWWLAPALLLGLWGALQLVPLPASVLRAVSPETHRVYVEAFPGYPDAVTGDGRVSLESQALERVPEAASRPVQPGRQDEALGVESPACLERSRHPLSLQPSATRDAVFWFAALMLSFLVVRDRVADRKRFRIYRWTLFGLFGALAVFALVQAQTWNGRLYWTIPLSVVARPFGPYYNPTNLAGVMELAVPFFLGYAWSRVRRVGRRGFREARVAAVCVAASVCLIAGLASASKMAAVVLVSSLFLLSLLGARTFRSRAILASAAAVLLIAGGLILPTTRLGERTRSFLQRSQEVSQLGGRLTAWQDSLGMLADFPITGTGFGSFAEVFPRYVRPGAPGRWNEAHNDYLEVVLEGGVVAGVLTLWLLVGFVSRVPGRLIRGGERSMSRTGLALGVAALAVHALVDFNHQIPGNALIWVVACAMLVPVVVEARR